MRLVCVCVLCRVEPSNHIPPTEGSQSNNRGSIKIWRYSSGTRTGHGTVKERKEEEKNCIDITHKTCMRPRLCIVPWIDKTCQESYAGSHSRLVTTQSDIVAMRIYLSRDAIFIAKEGIQLTNQPVVGRTNRDRVSNSGFFYIKVSFLL